jgi:outer membrane protein assembly factor BamA
MAGLVVIPQWACAQEASADSDASVAQRDLFDVVNQLIHGSPLKSEWEGELKSGLSWVAYPTVSYNPVSGFSVGASVSGAGPIGDPQISRISALTVNAAYSTTDQLKAQVKGDLYLAENALLLKLDTRYLNATRSTYGLGSIAPGQQEYPIDFVMARGYLTTYYRLGGTTYAGLGYHLDTYADIYDQRAGAGESTPYTEYSGANPRAARSAGISVNLLDDRRDNPVNPRAGYYLSASFRSYMERLGSNAHWQEMLLEFRAYPLVPRSSRNRLAFWLSTWFTFGDPPYLNLPYIGGDTFGRTGRGFLEGRIRGRSLAYMEFEYRFDLRRDGLLGLVVFVNGTSVTDPESGVFGRDDIGKGVGLRVKFSKKTDTNLTIDLGWDEQGASNFFLGTTEAF